MKDLSIDISRNFRNGSVELYVTKHIGTSEYNVTYFDGDIIDTEIQQSVITDVKPFLILPRVFAEAFFAAIHNYNSEHNIKTDNEHLLAGKLEATNSNLVDMRNVVTNLFNLLQAK